MKRLLFFFLTMFFIFGASASEFELNVPIVKSGAKGEISVYQPIGIYNLGKESLFQVKSFSDENFIFLDKNEFNVEKEGFGEIEMKLTAPDFKEGVYIGRIEIISGDEKKTIPIVFEQESEEVDFDAVIQISPAFNEVSPGGEFVSQINLYRLGGDGKEVGLEFFISDVYGNRIAEEKSTVLVDSELTLTKSFIIPENTETGDYLFYVNIKSGDSFGTSSAYFSVGDEVQFSPSSDGSYWAFILVIFLAGGFLVFNYLWKKRLKTVANGLGRRITDGKLADKQKELARLVYEFSLLEAAYKKGY